MVSFKEFLLMEALNSDKDIEDFLNNGKDEVRDIINDFDTIDAFSKTEDLSDDEKNEFIKYIIVYIGYSKLNPNFTNTIKDDFSNNGAGFKGILNKNGLPVANDFVSLILDKYLEFNGKRNSAKIAKLKETIDSDEDFINDMGLASEDGSNDENDNNEGDKESQDQKESKNNDENKNNETQEPQAEQKESSSYFSEDDWEVLFKEKKEEKIKNILNKLANGIISKMEKTLSDRKERVSSDRKLLGESAQEELWNNILNEKIDLGNGNIIKHDKSKSVNMYKGNGEENADKALEHYKNEIEQITNHIAARIAEINGNRSFNSSDAKLNKYRNQVRNVVLNYHTELNGIKNEFSKQIEKTGLIQKFKIDRARDKEKSDEYFNNSEQGEMYQASLAEKTKQILDKFNSVLKRPEVKTFEDMIGKQITTLIAAQSDSKSFARAAMIKTVLTENGKTMLVFRYLLNKGIKIPLFDGKEHKQSGLDSKAYSDAFNQFKQNLADNEKYGNDSTIKNLIGAINKETPENKANDNGLKIEAALIRKALKKDVRDNNQGQQNNNPPRGLRNRAEAADQEIEDNNMKNLEDNEDFDATVTTAKCDGLPIGARRYSRAIRRRMNYALNKYM